MTYLKNTAGSAICALTLAMGLASNADQAEAGPNPSLGDIMIVGFNFCPRGWAMAEGQILPINQNQSLYSLLGTTYGGDGRTSFALPDLRGRFTVGIGSGPGLTPKTWGERGGSETATMTEAQMPSHSHAVNANNLDGNKAGPGGKLLAAAPTGGTGNETIYSTAGPTVTMSASMIGNTGGGQQFNTQDPFLALVHCIAVTGTFPSRN
jgi:microcystin-dependent protein